MIFSISYNGLHIEAEVDYDPGQPYPSYSCGGVPPSWGVEVFHVELEEPDEFIGAGAVESFGDARNLSAGVQRMLEACICITGLLLPALQEYVLDLWDEGITEDLIERYKDGY